MGRLVALTLALLGASAPLGLASAQAPVSSPPRAAPEYLAEPEQVSSQGSHRAVHWAPDAPDDGDYRGMLAASYLLAIPAAAMTGGVGILLPVGMHYHHENRGGGLRALFGIVGGVAAGATVGGLVDQPEGGFELTTGMLAGMASGFFAWGVIDVAFFGVGGQRGDEQFDLGVQVNPDLRGAELGIRGRL